ncbi:MAG TPA: flagellar FlbD family protein [Solirubrobacteraceae bacterium]
MIRLHRLGSSYEPFHVNPDLIATLEGHPDVVLTLTNGTKIVVAETDDEVVAAVRRWKIDVMTEALDAADSRPRTF